ncbi:helix-turn-helix domain-containing protein [Pseudoduganella eburnea]|uniref:Helix-turn-helix domain-containing protein n=1 Tax=Massilia eburnea TaxID=1776165 RepID=A0A6L6QKS2_9BURK|nr:AraC family transcriptional regulator [Massilia eburnea]MTW12527.1 helix-turn-helix domain-containing protein [Massilia eburnea]
MLEQLNELRRLASRAENRPTETGIPRVFMVQGSIPEHELTAVYEPMVNLILQGGKTLTVGDQALDYDPATYFVMSVGLPAAGVVRSAVDGAPYLAVALTLTAPILAELFAVLPDPTKPANAEQGFSVASVTPELLDAWVRMLRLMDCPADIPVLAPVFEREILYRVLQGPAGWMLRDIAVPDSTLARVNKVIKRIRSEFAQPLVMEVLAEEAAMSASAFHRHFKAVTSLSPLQYQKQLRLLEARKLLMTTGKNVAAVAYDVGYDSATQFSREYGRAFGLPPAKDALRIAAAIKMRAQATASS